MTYSATGLPTGATFNAATKTFAWTPGTGTAGTYSVTFKVQDPDALNDTEIVAITVTAPAEVDLPVPTALWSMNDAAATTRITDSGGLNLHGTAKQNTSLLTAAGKFGTAIAFNGTSDFVSCGNNAALLPAAWSVSAWVRCEDTANPTLLSFGNYRAVIKLQNNGAGKPAIIMGAGNYRMFDAAAWTKLKDGQWHHVVFTLPGTEQAAIQSAQMYLDGAAVSAVATVASSAQNAKTELFLGNTDAAGTQRFKGAMDEVRLYNRALTLDEIEKLAMKVQ